MSLHSYGPKHNYKNTCNHKKKKRKIRRLTWCGGMKDEDLSSVEDGRRGEENEREDRDVDIERREEEEV